MIGRGKRGYANVTLGAGKKEKSLVGEKAKLASSVE
jgi:hypothetical protein